MAEERAYLYRNAGTKASPVWERWYPRTMVDAVEMGDEDGTTPAEYLKNIGTGFSDIYVTPEQFGAKGNGIDDDSPALLKALETGRPVMLKQDLYLKSRILVIDKNVFLDGCGYTLHCDGGALDFKDNSDFFAVYASTLPEGKDGDCSIISETNTFYDTYHRGYVSYHGRKPIPQEETYTDYTESKFNEYRAVLKNIKFQCQNFKGLVALNLRKMCHSCIQNVSTVCTDTEGTGSVGILVDSCCYCTIRDCYSSGWTDDLSCDVTNRGYGICANGNSIVIDGCEAWNCKHTVSVAGNRSYWSTDIKVQNCIFGLEYKEATRIDGSQRYQQVMDSHAAGLGVNFENCTIRILGSNESGSPTAFLISAPDVRISNLLVQCDGGGCWCNAFGLAERVYLDQVRGKNLVLQPNSGYENLKEAYISGCVFRRVQNAYNHPLKLYMTDTIVLELIDGVQWLRADNCKLYHQLSWPSKACITVLESGIFTNCVIYGHDEETIPPARSIIQAPANSIKMKGCMIYIRNGKFRICDTEQRDAVDSDNWIENIFGFHLDTENAILDKNELF